jgi:hypothetical protein
MRRRSFLRGLLGVAAAPAMIIAAAETVARREAAEAVRRKLISEIVDVQPMTVKHASVFFLKPYVYDVTDISLVPTDDERLRLKKLSGRYAAKPINHAYYARGVIKV